MLKEDCEFLCLHQDSSFSSFPEVSIQAILLHPHPCNSSLPVLATAARERQERTLNHLYLQFPAWQLTSLIFCVDALLPSLASLHGQNVSYISLCRHKNYMPCNLEGSQIPSGMDIPSVAMVLTLKVTYNSWVSNFLSANIDSIRSSNIIFRKCNLHFADFILSLLSV